MIATQSQAIPNFEEAASVASEFIASLDNLPNEVRHLLQEIEIKDQQCQEIQQDIAKDQSKYIKSLLKQCSFLPDWRNSDTDSNPKTHLPGRISAAYAQIEALSSEKMSIARQIIHLLTRTRARLDADLSRVRILQGESPEDIRPSVVAPLSAPSYGTKHCDSSVIGVVGPVIQIGESLRTAATTATTTTGLGKSDTIHSISGLGYNKKRRLTTNTSIKLSSPAPTAATSRSRLSRQSRVQQEEETAVAAEDLEGDDAEEEEEEEDLTLYCFCHKQSYGDMIGCDNATCPYQWFHITCVGVKTPLPDKWYCLECIKPKNTVSEKRRGRKK